MSTVCDVYDAITSNRPYKEGWDPGESLRQMASWKGHFDPAVLKAFIGSLGIYPIGTLVRLSSDRLAVVVEQGTSSLLNPVVKVFFSTKANQPITPELLEHYKVCSLREYGSETAEGKPYTYVSSVAEPMYGYKGRAHQTISSILYAPFPLRRQFRRKLLFRAGTTASQR